MLKDVRTAQMHDMHVQSFKKEILKKVIILVLNNTHAHIYIGE